jgi:predicted nucleotidyltransferase/predicted RNase H-like HicB family nuclease
VSQPPDVTITYEDGWVVASVRGVRGVHSQGRTREQARANALDALRGVTDLRTHPDAGRLSFHLVERAARRLAAAAHSPARVILFGSYARGDAGPDSDVDFLVIERDVPDRHAEMVRLGREVRSLGVPVDVVVLSEAYVEEWGSVKNTLVHAALSEGRELARNTAESAR